LEVQIQSLNTAVSQNKRSNKKDLPQISTMSQYNGKEKMMRVRQRDGLDAYLQAQQEIPAFTIEYYNF